MQGRITPEDVFKFQTFVENLDTDKQNVLDEIYQTDTDRTVENELVSNLVVDVNTEIEKSRQVDSRTSNSEDIQELEETLQENNAEIEKQAGFEEEEIQPEVLDLESQTDETQQEERNEFSDMSRKELEELIRSLRIELKIKTQDLADKDSELEQSRYMIQQLQNELSTVLPNNLILKKENADLADSSQIRNNSFKLKNKPSKNSIISTTVKSEESDFWRITEEKPENELTKFEEIAAAKDLWIVNAEKLPMNSYIESKQSLISKSSGVKANPLTKQPLAALPRNGKLNSRLLPSTSNSHSTQGPKQATRSVPKLITKSAFLKS